MFFHRFTTDWFGFVIYKTCSSTSSPCLLYLLYHGSLRDGNIVKWEVESEQRSHALGLIALRVWKGRNISMLMHDHLFFRNEKMWTMSSHEIIQDQFYTRVTEKPWSRNINPQNWLYMVYDMLKPSKMHIIQNSNFHLSSM